MHACDYCSTPYHHDEYINHVKDVPGSLLSMGLWQGNREILIRSGVSIYDHICD